MDKLEGMGQGRDRGIGKLILGLCVGREKREITREKPRECGSCEKVCELETNSMYPNIPIALVAFDGITRPKRQVGYVSLAH